MSAQILGNHHVSMCYITFYHCTAATGYSEAYG